MRVADLALAKTIRLSDSNLDALMGLLRRGEHPMDTVKRLYPRDRQAQRVTYRKLKTAILYDPRVAELLREESQLALAVGLVPTVNALVRRAARGNVPAQKLVLEATGVHNPRVRHEHSGEITIKFDAPRPTFEGTAVEEAGP